MFKFIFGVILGIAIATVGVDGVGKIVTKGVAQTQTVIKDVAK
jgi:hypothetical protein